MFSREQIVGIITVVVLKLLEIEGTVPQRETGEEDDLNEADKQPQEHDERLCWEKVAMFYIYSLERNKEKLSFPELISKHFTVFGTFFDFELFSYRLAKSISQQ